MRNEIRIYCEKKDTGREKVVIITILRCIATGDHGAPSKWANTTDILLFLQGGASFLFTELDRYLYAREHLRSALAKKGIGFEHE